MGKHCANEVSGRACLNCVQGRPPTRCARCVAVTLHDGPTVWWFCGHLLTIGLTRDILYILTCKMRLGYE